MELNTYDLIIINSSGGKDSLCAIWEVCRLAEEQGFDKSKIVVSHQDLGDMEWPGTKDLVQKQCKHFGLPLYVTTRRNAFGREETLLEYVERRGKWPSNKQRYCTSDFKRGPGSRVVTRLTAEMKSCRVLYVFGFRREESPARSKKEALCINKRLSTKKRIVHEWLPIHDWKTTQVWRVIKSEGLPYHKAYDLGMPRLSCCFCIFSPFDALVLAGKHNPQLLEAYVKTEAKIGHRFKSGMAISDVQDALKKGYEPKTIADWVM